MSTHRFALPAVVAVALSGAIGITGPVASAGGVARGDHPWIAYQTGYHKTTGWGPGGIWLVHPDGSGDHQVAVGVHDEQALPDWSPDGSRLAFSTRGGSTEPLFEYDLTTETTTQLFACEEECLGDDEPAYSPDGAKVAFIRALGPFTDTGPSDCSLWIGELASHNVQQLTKNGSCDRETMPRWSPDGTRLTYYRELYDQQSDTVLATAVFILDVATAEEHQLTPWSLDFGEPDWSPDGNWIVMASYPLHSYNSGVGAHHSNLFRIHPNGTGLEQITSYQATQARATQPRYAPDGTGIVFTAVTHNSRELWIQPNADGKPTRVTNGGIATHGTLQP